MRGFSEGSGKVNEDAFAMWSGPRLRCAIVADGAGGTGNGKRAAQEAVAIALAAAQSGRLDNESALSGLLYHIDQHLALVGEGGMTTLVMVLIDGEELVGAAVGDSVAWTLDGQGELLDLTESASRKPLLGSGSAIVRSFCCRLNNRLLLMTDGAYRYVPLAQSMRLFGTADLAAGAKNHFAAIRAAQGQLPDDATVVLLDPNLSEGRR